MSRISCRKAVQTKFFTELMSRAKQPLKLIHPDICGHIEPASLGENSYFLTLIDDYNRETWAYILNQKYEAFSAFKRSKAFVEKHIG